MAWIESHKELERHPKVLHLMGLLGTDLDRVLGGLHRFWWWCLDYAEDGDLRKYSRDTLTNTIGIDVDKLIKAKFIDEQPYLRVHDWWDYIGRFLQTKYKNYPEKWQRIQGMCKGSFKGGSKRRSKPKLPNLTKPKEEKNIVPQKTGNKPPHTQFVDNFKESYESMTDQPYKADKTDFIISKKLLDKYGQDAVVKKVKILGFLCKDQSAWFTKDGWASFSIKKLSAMWNSILPELVGGKEAKDNREMEEAKEKIRRDRERINRSINATTGN